MATIIFSPSYIYVGVVVDELVGYVLTSLRKFFDFDFPVTRSWINTAMYTFTLFNLSQTLINNG